MINAISWLLLGLYHFPATRPPITTFMPSFLLLLSLHHNKNQQMWQYSETFIIITNGPLMYTPRSILFKKPTLFLGILSTSGRYLIFLFSSLIPGQNRLSPAFRRFCIAALLSEGSAPLPPSPSGLQEESPRKLRT